MTRRALSFAAALLFAAAPGCTKKKNNDRTDPKLRIPKTTQVKLVAGKGPVQTKQKLRYRFKAGQTATAVLEMRMTMGMQMGARTAPPQTLPPIQMTFVTKVEALLSDGRYDISFKVTGVEVVEDPGVPPRLVTKLRDALRPVSGFNGSMVMSSRGVTSKFEVKLPPGLPPNLAQFLDSMKKQMQQLAVPLPVEAVGEGSTWRATVPFRAPPLDMAIEHNYELVKLTGNTAHIKVKGRTYIPAQKMKLPNAAGGATGKLLSGGATHRGEMTLEFDKPMATRASTSGDSTTRMQLKVGEKSMEMRMDVGMKTTLTPKP